MWPGKGADLVPLDWKQIAYPYLDEETPLLDAVIQRDKAQSMRMTMCDGEVIYQEGKFTKVDRDATLKALYDDMSRALSHDGAERRHLSEAYRRTCTGSMPTTLTPPSMIPSSGQAHASDAPH